MSTFDTEIRRRYSAIRSGVPTGMSITVLHIGAQQTGPAHGSDREPEAAFGIGVGSQKTADDYFRHAPPTPEELERAIAAVEDEVMRVRMMITSRSALFTTDAAIREIATIAGVPEGPGMAFGLDVMERTFERMAAVVLGRPAIREDLPADAAFVATLLILREVMHHLRFPSITVTA